ncbi:MAG: AMP-binding protein, partial [Candidatus Kapaibacteriota bacterium]
MPHHIDSVLTEHRTFPPSTQAQHGAHVSGAAALRKLQRKAAADPASFWAEQAAQLHWQAPWKTVLEWKYPQATWFKGGRLNVAENCLDRHLDSSRANKAALIWEGEPGDMRTLTYRQLHREVCKAANMLLDLGVKRGDVVGIYMGMVPEAVIAMLACARIGATHNVVFGGFSADAVAERMNDSGAVVLITQDGAWRRGAIVELKQAADAAVKRCPKIRHMVVVKRTAQAVKMKSGRDHWWHELLSAAASTHRAKGFGSEHPLFILYTSGSTGKPKGILHTTGGYLTQVAWTAKHVFDLRDTDVYFCTADIGWITGHSYIVYGPLANGATVLMYEGAPMHPEPDRLWTMVERHGATIFYTAPTAIRAFMKSGEQWPARHDLSSLRLLGTV